MVEGTIMPLDRTLSPHHGGGGGIMEDALDASGGVDGPPLAFQPGAAPPPNMASHLWGPWMWGLLHGTAHALATKGKAPHPAPRLAAAVAAWRRVLRDLHVALACAACRGSVPEFLALARAAMELRSPEETGVEEEAAAAPVLVTLLHDMVETKLLQARWEGERGRFSKALTAELAARGVAAAPSEAAVAAAVDAAAASSGLVPRLVKRLTVEEQAKRVRVGVSLYWPNDVWRLLLLLCLAHDAAPPRGWGRWLADVAALVELQFPPAHPLGGDAAAMRRLGEWATLQEGRGWPRGGELTGAQGERLPPPTPASSGLFNAAAAALDGSPHDADGLAVRLRRRRERYEAALAASCSVSKCA